MSDFERNNLHCFGVYPWTSRPSEIFLMFDISKLEVPSTNFSFVFKIINSTKIINYEIKTKTSEYREFQILPVCPETEGR